MMIIKKLKGEKEVLGGELREIIRKLKSEFLEFCQFRDHFKGGLVTGFHHKRVSLKTKGEMKGLVF